MINEEDTNACKLAISLLKVVHKLIIQSESGKAFILILYSSPPPLTRGQRSDWIVNAFHPN